MQHWRGIWQGRTRDSSTDPVCSTKWHGDSKVQEPGMLPRGLLRGGSVPTTRSQLSPFENQSTKTGNNHPNPFLGLGPNSLAHSGGRGGTRWFSLGSPLGLFSESVHKNGLNRQTDEPRASSRAKMHHLATFFQPSVGHLICI